MRVKLFISEIGDRLKELEMTIEAYEEGDIALAEDSKKRHMETESLRAERDALRERVRELESERDKILKDALKKLDETDDAGGDAAASGAFRKVSADASRAHTLESRGVEGNRPAPSSLGYDPDAQYRDWKREQYEQCDKDDAGGDSSGSTVSTTQRVGDSVEARSEAVGEVGVRNSPDRESTRPGPSSILSIVREEITGHYPIKYPDELHDKIARRIRALYTDDDAGVGSPQSGGDGINGQTTPSSEQYVGPMIVRGGVPYREPNKREKLATGIGWRKPTDDPADLPYKLAWERFKRDAGKDALSRITGWNGDYEVWRVGDCEHEWCWHVHLKEVSPGSSGVIEHGVCSICHGDGGLYEMRAKDGTK
jgi:hypothetical protein